MISFKLPPREEKADYVHRQFERIAAKYDLTNDAISMGMHRLWKAHAVSKLVQNPRGSYLDVCCGTGDLALTIGARLEQGGTVTGLDFSAGMLAVARRRADLALCKNKVRCGLRFVEGDAQQLPFDDNSFDGAIISFGLRNLTDLPQGLSEMKRVVKPGGLVINLDLGEPKGLLFAPLFNFYFGQVVPIIGHVLQNDRQAYTYLPESRRTYPKPEALSAMFAAIGLTDVTCQAQAFGSVAMHVGTVAW